MTEIRGISGAQVASILERLETERDRRSEAIEQAAAERCQSLLRQARAEGRRKVGIAVAEVREANAAKLRRVVAALETRARHRQHRRQSALIEAGRAALREALIHRWQHPRHRQSWCRGALEEATRLMLERQATLVCAPGVADDERERLSREAREQGWELSVTEDPGLVAGVCVTARSTRLDGSLAGLLADAGALDARFLALLEGALESDDD